jgi:D-glycerate 3-kinase
MRTLPVQKIRMEDILVQVQERRARELVDKFRHQEALPEYWAHDALQWFLPLAETIAAAYSGANALCIGINGAQGTGKSTLAKLLVMLLKEQHQLNAVAMSLDDFYYSHRERQHLAQTIHPLLATRGVPGTHDIELALDTVQRLRSGESVRLPRFSKAADDCVPRSDWQYSPAQTHVVILEGWCIGIPAQTSAQLLKPVNELETNEDPDGHWRHYVNDCLANRYQVLFEQLDLLIMLQAPDFGSIFEWRLLQEEKLRASLPPGETQRVMSAAQIRRFITHYERLTRHALAVLPKHADVVFRLNQQHSIVSRERHSG